MLDGKGRLAMPTRYREALLQQAAGRITVTRHPHGCLLLFPRPQWEQFRARLTSVPMDAQWWKRVFFGNASDVELDSSGRVLIAPELREAAGLTKELMLLGMGQHFELWDKVTYLRGEADALQQPLPDAFRDFSF